MIKKTLTYLDYEGNEHTKDFYFSMNQTEFSLLNNRIPGGYEAYLKRIQEDHDEAKLLELLTTFIVESYGERTTDGLGFIKEDAQGRKLGKLFMCTEACDNLLTELLEKENDIGSFLTGILPASLQPSVKAKLDEMRAAAPEGSNITALPTSAE